MRVTAENIRNGLRVKILANRVIDKDDDIAIIIPHKTGPASSKYNVWSELLFSLNGETRMACRVQHEKSKRTTAYWIDDLEIIYQPLTDNQKAVLQELLNKFNDPNLNSNAEL